MLAGGVCVLALLLFSSGCANVGSFYKRESRAGRTQLEERIVSVPAKIIGNHFLIEVAGDKRGPWRFLIDTGSSVTLVSPDFAARFGLKHKETAVPAVRIRSSDGGTTALQAVNLRRLTLGDARFLNVRAYVYDCDELSTHLGVRLDGILGFPLFREVVFTLDYPQERFVMARPDAAPPANAAAIEFNNERRTPIIPLRLGEQRFFALIDSGSDGPLLLNPFGLNPDFSYGPRIGATVGTLAGDRPQRIGRLSQTLAIGPFTLAQPVVDLTDQLSALGGEILKNFRITFDPPRNQVAFAREPGQATAILPAPRRSTGLSFDKTPAYWRIVGVVPDSPADMLGVRRGDLIARINGEPVSAWPLQRLDALIRRAAEITFTLIQGERETPRVIPTFDLVP
jgi:hypothetical protein